MSLWRSVLTQVTRDRREERRKKELRPTRVPQIASPFPANEAKPTQPRAPMGLAECSSGPEPIGREGSFPPLPTIL